MFALPQLNLSHLNVLVAKITGAYPAVVKEKQKQKGAKKQNQCQDRDENHRKCLASEPTQFFEQPFLNAGSLKLILGHLIKPSHLRFYCHDKSKCLLYNRFINYTTL